MGLFRYILGGEGRRNLKRLDRLADRVLSLDEKYSKFTDEELKDVRFIKFPVVSKIVEKLDDSDMWRNGDMIFIDNETEA